MEDLAKLLPKLMRRLDDSAEAREQSVFSAWSAGVGKPVARATTPVKLRRNTLVVAVADRNWRSQLTRMSKQIIFRINTLLGQAEVAAVEFVVNEKLVRAAHPVFEPVAFKTAEAEAEALRPHIAGLTDPELGALFLRAAGKCLDRRSRWLPTRPGQS